MPELPEVETMARGLRPALTGRVLSGIKVLDESLLQTGTDSSIIMSKGKGAKIESVERSGKWIMVVFGNNRGCLVIQPRMTGGFWLVEPPRPDHVRMEFLVKGGQIVRFTDIRRLARIAYYPDVDTARTTMNKSQGKDALLITAEDLRPLLKTTSRGIKPVLMDQKILAGVGNIYADETLFRAKIHPECAANQLTDLEIDRLGKIIPQLLQEAIAAEGATFDAGYKTVLGLEGGFLAKNAMYGREGLPCPACQTPIIKTKIAGLMGRPTYYCGSCQRLPAPKNVNGSS